MALGVTGFSSISAGQIFLAVRPSLTGFQSALGSQLKAQETGARAKFASFGKSVVQGAAIAGVAAAAISVKMAADFDESFARIRASSNASSKDIEKWRKQILTLGPATGKSPKELADALYFLSSAGLKSSQVFPTLAQSAKASAIGMGDVTDIAKLTAQALNAYNKEGLTASQVTDSLAAAVKAGTADPAEFATAMGRLLPVAEKAGLSFQNITGALAQMTTAGLDVNEGVTAIRGAILGLEAPATQTSDALHKIGLSADDVRKELADKGLIDTFRDLEARSVKLTGSQSSAIDVMHQLVPNTRALAGVLNLVGQRSGAVDKTMNDVTHSSGELNHQFKEYKKDNIAFQFKQLEGRLQAVAVAFGNFLIPKLEAAAKWFSKNRTALIVLGAVLGGVVLAAIGAFIASLTAVTLIIVGVGVAVSALAGLVIANWKTIRRWTEDVWSAVKRTVGDAIAGILTYFRTMFDVWRTVAGGIVDAAAKAFGWIPGVGSKIKDATANFNNWTDNVDASLGRQIDHFKGWEKSVSNTADSTNSHLEKSWSSSQQHMQKTASDVQNKILKSHQQFAGKILAQTNEVRRGVGLDQVPIGALHPGGGPAAALAKGTKDWGGGLAKVGEQGPEIVYLPEHSAVLPAKPSKFLSKMIPGFAKGLNTGRILELFWPTMPGGDPDTPNHLHLAMTPQQALIQWGRFAQSHGFSVSEGPGPFGPVHRVHAPNSYHYRGLAEDINWYGMGAENPHLAWLAKQIMGGSGAFGMSPEQTVKQALKDVVVPVYHGALAGSAQKEYNTAREALIKLVRKNQPKFSSDLAVSGSASAWLRRAMAETGAPGWWLPKLQATMMAESGGDPTAHNASGASGLMQMKPATFAAYSRGGSIWNPVANAVASILYRSARYSGGDWTPYGPISPYDRGGWLPRGLSLAYNGTGRPERVLAREPMHVTGHLTGVLDSPFGPAEMHGEIDAHLDERENFASRRARVSRA